MNQYKSSQEIPSSFTMTNPVTMKIISKEDNTCQPSFTYFKKKETPSVYWGSEKPMDEVCPTSFKSHTGIPSHSLWNNSTKRKTIINN